MGLKGPDAVAETCDASDGDAVLALAERVRRNYGVPDVVVYCAGLGQWKRIEDTTPAEALEMIKAPYLAVFNMTHAFMEDMLTRRSGVFIPINSPAWARLRGRAARHRIPGIPIKTTSAD